MYHDAPVQAASVVHRHTTTSAARSPAALMRTYQLRRVVDFVLHGHDVGDTTTTTTSATAAAAAAPATSTVPRYTRVALQFPDELLGDAVAVLRTLDELLRQRQQHDVGAVATTTAAAAASDTNNNNNNSADPNRPRGVRFFVLADNTFASCCPDEITAQHYAADCLVHFGDACMSKSTRLPVLYVHPAFAFRALTRLRTRNDTATTTTTSCSGEHTNSNDDDDDAATRLVAGVVARLVTEMQQWWRASGSGARDGDVVTRDDGGCGAAVARLCLVVVGAYATLPLLSRAEQRLLRQHDNDSSHGNGEDKHDTAVQVHWCRAADECSHDNANNNNNNANNNNNDDVWTINGVCVRRRAASSPLVQLFLYVGPASTMACCHVLSLHYYNLQHYTRAQHTLLQRLCDDLASRGVAPLMALDEHAGCSSGSNDDGGAAEAASCDASSSSWLVDVMQWQQTQSLSSCAAPLPLVTPACVQAEQMLRQRWRQRDYHVEVLRRSTAVGIVVASLAIQHYDEVTRLLHRLLRACGRRAYVLYIGHLNAYKLANFVDTVDCVVAVGCANSRELHYPCKRDEFVKPVLSPVEVLMALCTADDVAEHDGDKCACRAHVDDDSDSDSDSDNESCRCRCALPSPHQLPAAYTTSFAAVLAPLRAAVQHKTAAASSVADTTTTSTTMTTTTTMTGSSRGHRGDASGLVLVGGGGSSSGGVVGAHMGSAGALARLHERHFVGLDARVGQTGVQSAVAEGLYGVARGYRGERAAQAGGDARGVRDTAPAS